MVGVNGAGKTTTIGKMAKQFRNEGKSVIIAAGDTFRAAAVQQLQVWGERSGCPSSPRKPAPMPPASPSTRWSRRARESRYPADRHGRDGFRTRPT